MGLCWVGVSLRTHMQSPHQGLSVFTTRAPHSVDKRVESCEWLSVRSLVPALPLLSACDVCSVALWLVVDLEPIAAEGNTLLGWLVAPLPCGLASC